MLFTSRKLKGFSIIEAAVLMVVGSIMIASYSSLMAKKMRADAVDTTKARMDAIKTSFKYYFETNGKLPCPASLTDAPNTASFGREPMSATCTGAATGGTFAPTNAGKTIRIGAIPVRSLDLPDEMVTDAWGNRFVYAVTETLAQPYQYNTNDGGIVIKDKLGNDIATSGGKAHYAIVSLGPNHMGAYNMAGKPGLACNDTGLKAVEGVNCKNSGVFRIDLTTTTATVKTGYDDIIAYGPEKFANDLTHKVPTNMIAAFNATNCPDGWTKFTEANGRVIIGKGNYNVNSSIPLPSHSPSWIDNYTYNLRDTGGIAKPVLTEAQIPSHTHVQNYGIQGQDNGTDYWNGGIGGGPFADLTTDGAGGGAVHDNRQPWIAMLYCKKSP